MNVLDKLFSRELNRRAGARVIQIDTNDKIGRKKSQKRGSAASKAYAKTGGRYSKNKKTHLKPESKPTIRESSLFQRINIRFPWLKLVAVAVIGIIIILDLLDLTISKVNDPYDKIRVAPMSHHIRATERSFEGKKLIALTFDDGPSAATTTALLDVLFKKDVLATFFMLGNMAQGNPDLVKQVEKEHHEIASHTMYHQNLVSIPPESAEADIREAKRVISSIVGHDPVYTRPPYGNHNDTVRATAGTPIILWSVDSEDWRHKDTEAIKNTVMSEAYDGAIILMHDIYPSTIEAVPVVIDELRKAGYEFATIEELAEYKGLNLQPGDLYYNLAP